MPIRFRCTNCDQLMGIARRKAGAIVRCPACRREVAVPLDAADESSPFPAAAPPPRADLFDRDDFDALLAGGTSLAAARPVPPPVPAPRPLAELTEPRSQNVPEPVGVSLVPVQGGLLLSPGWVTTLTVVFLLLLALAFALGLLVGRHALAA